MPSRHQTDVIPTVVLLALGGVVFAVTADAVHRRRRGDCAAATTAEGNLALGSMSLGTVSRLS